MPISFPTLNQAIEQFTGCSGLISVHFFCPLFTFLTYLQIRPDDDTCFCTKSLQRGSTKRRIRSFFKDLQAVHPGAIEFPGGGNTHLRSKGFHSKMLAACESMVDVITDPGFAELTKNAIQRYFCSRREWPYSVHCFWLRYHPSTK